LYDAFTGAFTPAGNMTRPRADHTATLLPDGSVLIAGGSSDPAVERYDPATGTFTLMGGTLSARYGHTATLLPNGMVLIVGGADSKWRLLPSAELYDPGTGNSVLVSAYVDEYYDSTGTLLPDGRVLITGDNGGGLFDPTTNSLGKWSRMVYSQATPTSTLLLTGKVLIVGDSDAGDFLPVTNAAELYNPAAGAFEYTSGTIIPRTGHTATLLPYGAVLIAGGGCDSHCFAADTTELYDPAGGFFSLTQHLSTPRTNHTATLLVDGRVLVAGGWAPGNASHPGPINLATAEVYAPARQVPPAALLSMSGDGKGQGAVQQVQSYRLVTADTPAVAGDALMIYCTGLIDGSVMSPQVTIGGRLAPVISFGSVPGYQGLNYIDVFVPSGITPGGGVPVQILNYAGRPSNTVTIGVR
jgi:hypothetical protein